MTGLRKSQRGVAKGRYAQSRSVGGANAGYALTASASVSTLIAAAKAASRNLGQFADDPAIDALLGSLAMTLILAESLR